MSGGQRNVEMGQGRHGPGQKLQDPSYGFTCGLPLHVEMARLPSFLQHVLLGASSEQPSSCLGPGGPQGQDQMGT